MSKSYRFDPEDDFGGDNLRTMSKKELKALRRERRRNEQVLDEQMKPDHEVDDGLIR